MNKNTEKLNAIWNNKKFGNISIVSKANDSKLKNDSLPRITRNAADK